MAVPNDRPAVPADRTPPRLRVERLEERLTPTVLAVNDLYEAVAGKVLSVNVGHGALVNDLSTTSRGNALVADLQTNPEYDNVRTDLNPSPVVNEQEIILDPNILNFNADGSFTIAIPENAPAGTITFTYKAIDAIGPPVDDSAIATVTIAVRSDPRRLYAVAPDAGGGGIVRAFDAKTGIERFSVQPFEASYRGGLSVATGDLNGDGTDDVVVGAGFGGGPVVVEYDGISGGEIRRYFGIGDPNFRGGVNVAVGDVDQGGFNDIIIGAGEGGGPLVNVILTEQNRTFAFFAYESTLRSGVRVATGDIRDSGREAIITGPGFGGAPLVRAFDLIGLRTLANFFAYDPSTRAGVFVASGDFGRGYSDIVTGAGAGDPIVNVFDGKSSALQRSFTVVPQDRPTAEFFGNGPTFDNLDFYGPSGSLLPDAEVPTSLAPSVGAVANSQPAAFQGRFAEGRGGVRVAAVDRNRDGIADIVTGTGPGASPRVRTFEGVGLQEIENITAFEPTFLGGINVGGGPEPDTDYGD